MSCSSTSAFSGRQFTMLPKEIADTFSPEFPKCLYTILSVLRSDMDLLNQFLMGCICHQLSQNNLLLIFKMKSFNSPYSEQEQYSFVQSKNPIDPENAKLSKSFIDSKPMIQGLVRSVLKIEKSGQAHLINTGLTDVEGAKQIAQNLFGFYDREKSGTIDTVKTAPILNNAYRVFNSIFKPDKDDVNSFFETLDVDKNKKVTIEDMENLCIRYLTGTTSTFYNFHETQRQA